MLRFGIVGGGPIGLLYGTMLSQAGHSVFFLCRNAEDAHALHLKTLTAKGALSGSGTVAGATSDPATFAGFKLNYVLICTKAIVNEELIRNFSKAAFSESTVFVCCQNGVDVEEEWIGTFGSNRVLRTILNVGCGTAGNGIIDVKFKFADILSETPETQQASEILSSTLNSAGYSVKNSGTFKQEAFRKAILNTALGTVCAITRLTMKEVMRRTDLHKMVREMVREGSRVAETIGFDLGQKFLEEAMAYLAQGGDHMPSLALDIIRGVPTENKWLAGAIYKHAMNNGVDIPVTQTVYYFIKNIEKSSMDQQEILV